jgi:hypothetical protein
VQEDFLATESNILYYWKQPKNKHLTVQGVFLATTQQYSQLLKTTKKQATMKDSRSIKWNNCTD